ncbi:SH2 domain containing 1A duplicate a isoform X1 [Triplophysa rosa]|uniref:SH2 domain containing 1A duplicate a n=1 Tax=Triplophysa rosa TaxID=992332 RepID=A0A9W7X3Y0_TRIRA|nr:SH2 domain containing 1A duplicate a isoform X1 [Triplophysa rosa]KAI7813294.1 SH2 domain containing 1A duplicate a [Triplophysa rosa]
MEDLAEYHGDISKKRAEEILSKAGRDGSYLIRDSERLPGSYCACVLCGEWVYTYRVFKQKDGYWTIETAPGTKERFFRKVSNLISAFKIPDQGISVPLLYPVNKPKHQQ